MISKKINDFVSKYQYDLRVMSDMHNKYYVYDSVEAMLAARLRMGKVETIKMGDDEAEYALLSRDKFDKYEPSFRLEDKFSRTFDTVSKTCEMFNFRTFVGGAFGGISFKSVRDEEGTNIAGHLTYEGLCAYVALAPNEDLIDNKQYLSDEIVRNYNSEMEQIPEFRRTCSPEARDIGEKYIELMLASGEICKMAQEGQLGAEDEMAQE